MINEQKTDKYLLSIITVSYNAQCTIENTIRSVLCQTGQSEAFTLEYLFIDGASQDSTLQIIERYLPLLSEKGIHSREVSEPDNGIYDAMNKGIRLAQGKWVYLLNAGDCLYNSRVLQELEEDLMISEADILYGNYCRTNQYLSRIVTVPPIETLKKTMIFCHQAVLVKRFRYQEMEYNTNYRVVADYHFLLTMYLKGRKFQGLPVCMVLYDTDGVSARNMVKGYNEIYQVRRQAGVLGQETAEKIRYMCGLVKRIILGKMPQNFRWRIYRVILYARRGS